MQKVRVICADGRYRTATITRDWTLCSDNKTRRYDRRRARIQVRGKTVSGIVFPREDGSYGFSAWSWMKNADLLPGWGDYRPGCATYSRPLTDWVAYYRERASAQADA